MSVTELAEKSGLLKSSVHNILSTYEVCGLIRQNPDTGRYRLGVRVLELSRQFYRNNDIRRILSPHMNEIANRVGESVFLAMPNRCELIYLDGAFPRLSTNTRNMAGVSAPLYCTGLGKALLAFVPGLFAQTAGQERISFTPATITGREALERELELTRSRGYAIDHMEHEYGICCVAVPVFNGAGQAVAAMSISGPSPRFDEARIRELAALLLAHTAEIKKRLVPDNF